MDPKLKRIKALSHPLRWEIARIMDQETRPIPIKEVAKTLNQPAAKLHYHFKQLEAAGIIEVASTREINGITERYYRRTQEEVDFSLSMKEDREAAASALPLIETKIVQAIRRIQELDPTTSPPGGGSIQELSFSREKAHQLKRAMDDFLNHKPAQLPQPDPQGTGYQYDLVMFFVPKETKPNS